MPIVCKKLRHRVGYRAKMGGYRRLSYLILIISWACTALLCSINGFVFVCEFFFYSTGEPPIIRRLYHCRWRAANFELCSALMVIQQRGFLTCNTHCDMAHPFWLPTLKTCHTYTWCRASYSWAEGITQPLDHFFP